MDWIPRLLTVIAWGGVGLLLLLLYRIAHFYQATSGQPSHYRWFLIPLALLLLGGLRYAMVGDLAGDLLGDSLLIVGGAMLFILGIVLVRLMTGGRR